MMKKVGMVPCGWGALEGGQPLFDEEIEKKAERLISQMTLAEKTDPMSGGIPLFPGIPELQLAYNKRPYPAGENRRPGIAGIRFSDGPRRVVMYRSTCFPVAMARGATWDAGRAGSGNRGVLAQRPKSGGGCRGGRLSCGDPVTLSPI